MYEVGLGFRRSLKSDILIYKESFDCLEIITEQFFDLTIFQQEELIELSNFFKIIPHGLRLSIGSVERPHQFYLDKIIRLLEIIEAPYYSDHFAITSTPQKDIGHLSPLWYTHEALETVIKNITSVQNFLGVPLVLETITHIFNIPGNSMSQEEFITTACNETGCKILLDITNIFINSVNFDFNPKEFINNLPLGKVKQFHISGYTVDKQGLLLDTHSSAIQSEIWDLYKYALFVCQPDCVILERDSNFPEITELVRETKYARI